MRKPTWGLWLSSIALTLSLVGATMVVLGQFFAPKAIEQQLTGIQRDVQHLDWKIEVVRVGLDNVSAQLQVLNANVARLMVWQQIDAHVPAAPPNPQE